MQLPSLEDVVNALTGFVANAVTTVVKWLGEAVGWLWGVIYSSIVKPISDFINWLFETAKTVLVQPVLGFIAAAMDTIQRKAFGTLFIAITYKMMLSEAKKIIHARSTREALTEAAWLMVKPILIYLALSAAWKLITYALPSGAFTAPPWQPAVPAVPAAPTPSAPSAPGAPTPWTLAVYDSLDHSVDAGVHYGLLLESLDALDHRVTGGIVLPGTVEAYDAVESTVRGGASPPKTAEATTSVESAAVAGANLELALVVDDTAESTARGGAAQALQLEAATSVESSVDAGIAAAHTIGAIENDLLVGWSASV